MSRDRMALAAENEQLRAAVRELQAGRAVDPQEALAMVANALLQQETALGIAQRLTSVLVARLTAPPPPVILPAGAKIDLLRDMGPIVVSKEQLDRALLPEGVVEIERDEIVSLDGSALSIEEDTKTGRWTLTLRPPPSPIARPNGG